MNALPRGLVPPAPSASVLAAIQPLVGFYARARVPLPHFEIINPEDIPEPWRSLLVHDRDMTPTLEEHYGDEIHIEVLGRERLAGAYSREVILRLDRDDRAVEFGANRVALDLLPTVVRRMVLQEQLPFGHILKAHDVPHTGKPDVFLRVESDDLINRAFELSGYHLLYGRHNTLCDPAGRPISEVVEILPPHTRNTTG